MPELVSGGLPPIAELWKQQGFDPDAFQRDAILHGDGPLFITAGPGSGKTRVLLWRVVNLVVYRGVAPERIMLTTFTEKAAFQLKQGIRALLGQAANFTAKSYDTSRMFVGTVHSNCHRLMLHRALYQDNARPVMPDLMDELDQYLLVYHTLADLAKAGGFRGNANERITHYLDGRPSISKHSAAEEVVAFFNRMSEERVEPAVAARKAKGPILRNLFRMYGEYRRLLAGRSAGGTVDLSLLQDAALRRVEASPHGRDLFDHVIVDEYQDTNSVQEDLFFHLAGGSKNICVVGDDDQALYRFRGATVENLVEFPIRCRKRLGVEPKRVNLKFNRRSLPRIVQAYGKFMTEHDWRRPGKGYFRVSDKGIEPKRRGEAPCVVASSGEKPEKVCKEVAGLARQLLAEGKVADPSQIAFLYPSLHSSQVPRMIAALKKEGLNVYAPRAGSLFDIEEMRQLVGLLAKTFDFSVPAQFSHGTMGDFAQWLDAAKREAAALMRGDATLERFIRNTGSELHVAAAEYDILLAACQGHGVDAKTPYDPSLAAHLGAINGVRPGTLRYLGSKYLVSAQRDRRRFGRELTVQQVLDKAAGPDWNILDYFHRLCGFRRFKKLIDLAEDGKDEAPACNLALISRHIARFHENYGPTIRPSRLSGGKFERLLFTTYLYALFRRDESQYEDTDVPIPKGRIPFLTIHQAKGLEFPVVVLGSLRKTDFGPSRVEVVARIHGREQAEPLDRMAGFDIMRMFYVALSRAANLLVLCDYRGQGQSHRPEFDPLLDGEITRIPDLDVRAVERYVGREDEVPRAYSFTGDYLSYGICARQYMFYRRYDFAPSRMQTMMFGSLVHRTIEDLHQLLIAQRRLPA